MEYQFKEDVFETEVLQSDIPVLVDFYADWCGPCRMMAPVVAKLAEQYDGRLKVGKLNVDNNLHIAQKYRVASIPTFMVFKGGEPVLTLVGAMGPDELSAKLDAVL